jgi:hypothetical protein
VLELLTPLELIDAIAVAMTDLSTGHVAMPSRITTSAGGTGMLATIAPAMTVGQHLPNMSRVRLRLLGTLVPELITHSS